MNKNFLLSFILGKEMLKNSTTAEKTNKIALFAGLAGQGSPKNFMYVLPMIQEKKNDEVAKKNLQEKLDDSIPMPQWAKNKGISKEAIQEIIASEEYFKRLQKQKYSEVASEK